MIPVATDIEDKSRLRTITWSDIIVVHDYTSPMITLNFIHKLGWHRLYIVSCTFIHPSNRLTNYLRLFITIGHSRFNVSRLYSTDMMYLIVIYLVYRPGNL